MRKTLGGDRLGSGKKMQVDLPEFNRSTHNLSYIFRSTMSPGTLVPFLCEVGLPGDTWDITMNSDVKTHPTIGPLFGSYKLQYDIFAAPFRLYQGLLHNNPVDLGLHMSKVKLPIIKLKALVWDDVDPTKPDFDLDNAQINPSALLPYLGIRGIGVTEVVDVERSFNAIPILMYWDIYKNYYANKQEEEGAVLHTPAQAIVEIEPDGLQVGPAGTAPGGGLTVPEAPGGTIIPLSAGQQFWLQMGVGLTPIPSQILLNTSIGQKSLQQLTGGVSETATPDYWTGAFNSTQWGNIDLYSFQYIDSSTANPGKPSIATFELKNIDKMRQYILKNSDEDIACVIADSAGGGANLTPYKWLAEQPNGIPNLLSSQEGLALKTYQSDIFNNWLNSEWIDGVNGINAVTAIDTTGNKFTVEQLIMSNNIYMMLNAIAVSGGTYNDWQEVNYSVRANLGCESPMYMGGLSKELVFQEVVSNSASSDQPLGTLAGKGTMAGKHKGGKAIVKLREASYIMGIVSITPRLDYSQGNKWDTTLLTIDDLHKPYLDEIGFQDDINEKRAWWTTWYDGTPGVTKWTQTAAGKLPAWIDYMTNFNRTYGNFAIATNEMFMTLNRRYEPFWDGIPQISDLTTYIDPSKFNYIFADLELDAQNMWMQIGVDCEVRRVMSAKIMPNLR